MSRLQKVVAMGVALVSASAMVLGGASIAEATTGSSWYCSVTANVPYLSSGQVMAVGTATRCSGDTKTFYTQVHRSFGITNPQISQYKYTAAAKSYSGSSQGCDGGQRNEYFSQTFLRDGGVNGSVVVSATSGYLRAC